MPLRWKPLPQQTSADEIFDLFSNRIPAIIVHGFLTPQESKDLLDWLDVHGLKQYAYNFEERDAPEALHLFTTHYLFEDKSREAYRASGLQSWELYRRMETDIGYSPVDRLQKWLSGLLGEKVSCAFEEDLTYFPCIARELNHSVLLHADFSPFLSQPWAIRDIVQELAWNIYLTTPSNGGSLGIHNRPWMPKDDSFKLGNTYGYDPELVSKAETCWLSPRAGDLIMFNSRNFHQVEKASGRRVAIGGHLGQTADGPIIAWS